MQVRTTIVGENIFFIHVIMDTCTSTSTDVKLRLHFPFFKRIDDIRKGL